MNLICLIRRFDDLIEYLLYYEALCIFVEWKRMTPGEWLEKALLVLCGKLETGLELDADIISGLVSYCELAAPQDAAEYLHVLLLFYLYIFNFTMVDWGEAFIVNKIHFFTL